jgi:glycosyltransferase involved in cell wall biosynthesis
VPGMKKIFKIGGGGTLVKERNPEAVANEAVNLIRDPERYQRIQSAGLKNVRKNFLIQNSIQKLEAEYENLMKK